MTWRLWQARTLDLISGDISGVLEERTDTVNAATAVKIRTGRLDTLAGYLQPWGCLLTHDTPFGLDFVGCVTGVEGFGTAIGSITAESWRAYPHQVIYAHDDSWLGADAGDVITHLWGHCLEFEQSPIGVTVSGEQSGSTVGTPASGEGEDQPLVAAWHAATNVGDLITSLATEHNMRVTENSVMTDTGPETQIVIRKTPQARESGALFAADANLMMEGTPAYSGNAVATSVLSLGAGSGAGRSVGNAANPSQTLLRRVHLDQTAPPELTNAELSTRAARILDEMTAPFPLDEVTVIADHPNAPHGSYGPGDLATVTIATGTYKVFIHAMSFSASSPDTLKVTVRQPS